MHSYVCPNEKKECVYARLGRCIQSCTSMSKEKRVCVPELGSIYIAKEVTNVDSKYVVVRYPTMTMNEWRKNRKKVGSTTKQFNNATYPNTKKVKKHAIKRKEAKHIHLVWKEVPGYDKVVVQDIQQP